jgi:hypothetical protein
MLETSKMIQSYEYGDIEQSICNEDLRKSRYQTMNFPDDLFGSFYRWVLKVFSGADPYSVIHDTLMEFCPGHFDPARSLRSAWKRRILVQAVAES